MRRHLQRCLLAAALTLLIAACATPTPTPEGPYPPPEATLAPTTGAPAETVAPPPTTAPTAEPEPDAEAGADGPLSVEYDLGEITVVQSRFPEDSRFRNMPVRLNGLIAAPEPAAVDGPVPVVVILHGTHPGCPLNEFGVDVWPCPPEDEQPNYRGFDYLARYLADQGYVALSININAENTFGFGEGDAGERLSQLLDAHLSALAAAAAGGENPFGVELAGVADPTRLVFAGHSRGGEGAAWFAHEQGLVDPAIAAERGYGPVRGLLLIAPAVVFVAPIPSQVPMAAILPACDADVITQDGQYYYEAARLEPAQVQPATTVWLERANHNYFNEILGGDLMGNFGRPDCDPLLAAVVQRGFLLDYAGDFLTTLFDPDPAEVAAANARLGLDVTEPAPSSLYGLPARVAWLAPAADRLTLLLPASEAELTTNRAGGSVTAEGATTFFCPEGFFTPDMMPGSEPCRRVNVTTPGNPALVIVSWDQPGATLRLSLPEGAGDLSDYSAVTLRAVQDPLSPLNPAGQPQAFSVRLTDTTGNSATVPVRPDEPALGFPPGLVEENDFFGGGIFTGRAHMTTIRLLLSDFAGVDLANIAEIALIFDQTPAGSLFLGDLEVVR